MLVIKEPKLTTVREVVMARLAREVGRGHNAIFHGTRHAPAVLREGKLKGPEVDPAEFFSRSPEIAAYWALRMGEEIDQFSGAVLVLDRGSLTRSYRLEPSRYYVEWNDEREEHVYGRPVCLRRHLLGVVREAD